MTYQQFNNVFLSMMALVELSTTEGWVDVMWAAVDANGVDMQPIRDNAEGWVVFFCWFIIMGSFFVLNLFVGVVCDTFNEMRNEMGGLFLLTDTQKEWVSMRKKINKLGPIIKSYLLKKVPTNPFRKWCYMTVTHPFFDNFIMLCIILNTIIMSTKSFGQSTEWDLFCAGANYFFAGLFTVECVLKLIGLDPQRYFIDGWNKFDFVVVVGTNVGLIIKWVTGVNVTALATVIRTFRVCRVVRLVQSLKNLRALINTLIISLPSLFNIGMLLCLMVFIYAIIGVQQFAKVAHFDAIGPHANFESFPVAFLTLARSVTGENWNGMMYNLAEQTEGCVVDPKWDPAYCQFEGSDPDACVPLNGCGVAVTFPYWLAFTCMVTFCLLNVFVAVILEAFEDSDAEEDAKLTHDQWEEFCLTWCEYVNRPITSVTAAFKMDMNKLLPFFKELQEPMGFRRLGTPKIQRDANGNPTAKGSKVEHGKQNHIASDKTLLLEIQDMEIQTVTVRGSPGLWAEFSNVAVAVAKRVMVASQNGQVDAATLMKEFSTAETIESKASGRSLDKHQIKGTQVKLNARQYFAAIRIGLAFRSHKFRQRVHQKVEEEKAATMAATGATAGQAGAWHT